ncbi:MAG: hypothetical protein ACI35N_07660 [Marinilabiliaceae bacterium]
MTEREVELEDNWEKHDIGITSEAVEEMIGEVTGSVEKFKHTNP